MVGRRYMKLQSFWSLVSFAGDWLHFLYSKKKKNASYTIFFLFEEREGELILSWSLFSLSLVDICFIHTWFLILLLCTVVWFWVPLWARSLAGDEWRSALCFTSLVFHSVISDFVVFLPFSDVSTETRKKIQRCLFCFKRKIGVSSYFILFLVFTPFFL